ncbi:hypothetical protein MK904_13430 [Loigolactobacillus coryniformis]|jgi:hypothetical protein|nr:hypothetical protein [Loigolactobacillus coryniformis]MDT3392273.1 hypothetical protein [Bacillota bacterium]MBW4801479.1 hypothetical protein [Loigolactobacillus coryniformis subsp. torquens]MBW4804180.1 hypothetical protein [Loigolactobacillus coryniformis subsp. torquens]MCL5457190.1 hypothetical protein [Loigolactobacillus coryniformis]MDC4187072.1 hypothetical protein [Loigolactobacillus coryniformis]
MRLVEENFRRKITGRTDKKINNDVTAHLIQQALKAALVAHEQTKKVSDK